MTTDQKAELAGMITDYKDGMIDLDVIFAYIELVLKIRILEEK